MHLRALVIALGLVGLSACKTPTGGARLDEVVTREAERAAARSSVRFEVGTRDDERWVPETSLPRLHLFPRAEVAALDAYANGCGAAPASLRGALRKALAWARYRCGHAPLPANFFAEPPYMHPDGRSFAWHARGCAAPACAPARAADLHHAVERGEVEPARWPRLDRAALVRLHAGEPFANAGRTLLLRHAGGYASIEPAALAAANRRIGIGSPGACDARALGRCWIDLDERRAASLTRRGAAAAAVAALAGLAALIAWRILVGRKLAAERVFVLRWLAHELRTPVTALKLGIERLRDGFDQMPTPAQDGFLTMARDVSRLQRVVEASAVYLRADSARGEPRRPVASVRGFVEAVAAEATDAEVAIDAPDVEAALPVNTTALALRNLVRNAAEHGRPPCRVTATVERDAVLFAVSDGGELDRATIRSLGTAFVGRSGGLGIGLYLAHHAVRSMGGRLHVTRSPTCFSFRAPRGAA
jgi:signal transduction histidine kinase